MPKLGFDKLRNRRTICVQTHTESISNQRREKKLDSDETDQRAPQERQQLASTPYIPDKLQQVVHCPMVYVYHIAQVEPCCVVRAQIEAPQRAELYGFRAHEELVQLLCLE